MTKNQEIVIAQALEAGAHSAFEQVFHINHNIDNPPGLRRDLSYLKAKYFGYEAVAQAYLESLSDPSEEHNVTFKDVFEAYEELFIKPVEVCNE